MNPVINLLACLIQSKLEDMNRFVHIPLVTAHQNISSEIFCAKDL